MIPATRKLLVVAVILTIQCQLFAQKSILDSLKAVHNRLDGDAKAYNAVKLAKRSLDRKEALSYSKQALDLATTDTTELLAMNQLAWEYKNLKHFDSALTVLQKAESMAQGIDFPQGLADVYQTWGSVYSNQSLYDSALLFQQKALNIQEKTGDLEGMASLYNNMSIIHQSKGEYQKAREILTRSQSIWARLRRQKEIGDSYLNIGTLYFYQGHVDSCVMFITKALTIYEEQELPNFQVYALANLGIIYSEELGDDEKAATYFQKIIDIEGQVNSKNLVSLALNGLALIEKKKRNYAKATSLFERALIISKANQNNYEISGILTNLAGISLEQGDFADARARYEKSIAIKRSIGDNRELIIPLTGLADAEIRSGNLSVANKLLDEAYELAVATGNKTSEREVLQMQIRLSKAQGTYKEAVALYDQFIAVKDSILNKDKIAAIEDVKGKYETEKKEQEIVLLNQENALKEASLQRNTLLIFGLVALLVILLLIFYLIRTRTAQQHQQVLQEQKIRMRETQMQAVIDSQERERKRFATDLHDGMGQLVSALQLNIQSMKAAGNDLEKRDTLYGNSTQLLKDVHTEIRNIAFNLMPQTLVKEGLKAAIIELARKVNNTEGITVHPTFTDFDRRLSEIQEVSIYRVVQELLSNIMKYSQAKNVYIGITGYEEEVVVTLEDDGIGYDLDQFKTSEGNGWRNISSRVNLVQGFIEIDTRPGGKGSSVMMEIPTKEKVGDEVA